METRQDTVNRPLVLIVALMCALAIALSGFLALGRNTPPSTVVKPFVFFQDKPGPDAPSRVNPTPDIWAGHGH